jgi:ribosomal protein S18 acetylase RimI-like enzyme
MIKVQRITAQETYPLRLKVLRDGLQLRDCVFEGDDLPDTWHVASFLDGEIVGIASLLHRPLATVYGGAGGDGGWQLRGMATDPCVRGKGFGSPLVSACIEYAKENGGTYVWCNARIGALGFYERLGFEILSEEFDIHGVGPHRVMRRKLTN